MKTWTQKELLDLLRLLMQSEKGKHVSESDRAYKRGWRDCVMAMRWNLDQSPAASNESKEKT